MLLIGCNVNYLARTWNTMLLMNGYAGHRRAVRWRWVAAIWTGIALFSAIQNVVVMHTEGMHHAWTKLFIYLFFSWLPSALATPLVLYLGWKFPPFRINAFLEWGIHALACFCICVVWGAWMTITERLLNPWLDPRFPGPFLHTWLDKFYNGLLASLILYITTIVVGQMLESSARLAAQRDETARLNEQLSREQLNALRRQIEPHFLFNTLNGIAGLIREEKNDAAVSMIAGLSDFLRHLLKDSHQQVRLEEEMEFLQKYLDIERMRLGERLQLIIDVPEELMLARVPSLILQPMVENSIKHGISQRVQGGEIRIAAARNNGMLTLSVYNDGPGLPDGWESSSAGIGISNVRTRLQSLYADHFSFLMRNQPPGVEVSVSVPFKVT